MEEFCYLGTVIEEERKDWESMAKWREVTGVVCNKRIPLKTMVKIYESVIRPLLLYRTGSAALRREEEEDLKLQK